MLVTQNSSADLELSTIPYIELCFNVIGSVIGADHAYDLYGAISRRCPALHGYEGVSIQTITGIPDRQGKIFLSNEKSYLKIRIPYDPGLMSQTLSLSGKRLMIGQYPISLGIPKMFALKPAEILKSRIVIIKGFKEPEPLLEAAKNKLRMIGIDADALVPLNVQGEADRKTIKISKKIKGKEKSFTIVGFGLVVSELSPEDSIKLQILGIGGKRRMGCGIFVPYEVSHEN